MDFFGDEIEDIRTFEPDTQRSNKRVESLVVAAPPGKKMPLSESGILEYIDSSILWQLWEPTLIEEKTSDFFSNRSEALTLSKVLEIRDQHKDTWTGFSALDEGGIFFDQSVQKAQIDSETLEAYRSFPANETQGMDRFYQEQDERLRFFETIQN